MNRNFLRLLGVLVLAALGPTFNAAIAGQSHVLKSGKTVEIVGVGPLYFGDGTKAIGLKYRAQAPLDDLDNLIREVHEIWDRFVVNAENGNFENAVIMALGPQSGGIVKSGKTYGFIFRKRENAWRLLEPGKPARLTKNLIKRFLDREDWLTANKLVNGELLYMPKDYVLTISRTSIGQAPLTLNRLQYAARARQALSAVTDYRLRRDILDIVIIENGKKARIECRTFESGKIAGKPFEIIARTTDFLELRDGSLQRSKSIAEFEKAVVSGES